jgi:hypothetical protein
MPRISQQVELPGLAAGVPGKGNPNGKSQDDGVVRLIMATAERGHSFYGWAGDTNSMRTASATT